MNRFYVEPSIMKGEFCVRLIDSEGIRALADKLTKDDCLQLAAALAHAADGQLVTSSGVDVYGPHVEWDTASPFFHAYFNYQPPSELELLKAENAKLRHELAEYKGPSQQDIAEQLRRARKILDEKRDKWPPQQYPYPGSPYTLNPICESGGMVNVSSSALPGAQQQKRQDIEESNASVNNAPGGQGGQILSKMPSAIDLGPPGGER